MSDLISREEALNATKMVYIECLYMDEKDYEECMADDLAVVFASDIKKIPAVDAVPVVRCRECKQYNGHRYCWYLAADVMDDDFCSYGERRSND